MPARLSACLSTCLPVCLPACLGRQSPGCGDARLAIPRQLAAPRGQSDSPRRTTAFLPFSFGPRPGLCTGARPTSGAPYHQRLASRLWELPCLLAKGPKKGGKGGKERARRLLLLLPLLLLLLRLRLPLLLLRFCILLYKLCAQALSSPGSKAVPLASAANRLSIKTSRTPSVSKRARPNRIIDTPRGAPCLSRPPRLATWPLAVGPHLTRHRPSHWPLACLPGPPLRHSQKGMAVECCPEISALLEECQSWNGRLPCLGPPPLLTHPPLRPGRGRPRGSSRSGLPCGPWAFCLPNGPDPGATEYVISKYGSSLILYVCTYVHTYIRSTVSLVCRIPIHEPGSALGPAQLLARLLMTDRSS